MRAVLFAVAVLCPAVTFAYPIPPRTLWELTRDAELVVLATVEKVGSTPAKSEERWSDSHVATLAIREAWKGSAERAVEVVFSPWVVCPAPPRYVEGRVVVAFLRRFEGAWHTVAMSYGTRYPLDEVETQAYAEVVRAAAKALGPTPDKDAAPSREWALEAVRHRATRWDGLYALQAGADAQRAWYDRGRRLDRPLGEQTLAELERRFTEAPSYDQTLVQVLIMLEPRRGKAVTAAAADAIETVLHHENAPHWVELAIEQLGLRLGARPAPEAPLDPVATELFILDQGNTETPEQREARVQAQWDAFKRKHHLAPRVRDDYVRAPRTGTGGQTPP